MAIITELGAARTIRTSVYIGLLAVAALLLVSLGFAWLVLRLRAMRIRSGRE